MKYTLKDKKTAYKNLFFRIVEKKFELPDGKLHSYFVQEESDSCCVLARTAEGTYIAVKQYRVGPEEILLELPAGRMEDSDNDPAERMKKELLEETGYSGEMSFVCSHPASPYSTKNIQVFFADNCRKVQDQNLDADEFIEVTLLSEQELLDLLLSGSSSSCGPGLLAWHFFQNGKLSAEKA